jgi:hypothetical protein
MRVTFPRLPDHQRAYALVERDDGVICQRRGGLAGPRLPRDIMHLIVERELHIGDGVWAAIAAGAIPDQVRQRRAELLAGLVSSTAGLDDPTPAQIRRLTTAARLAGPQADPAVADPAVVGAAAQALQVEAARWARLRIGEHLSYDWPARLPSRS